MKTNDKKNSKKNKPKTNDDKANYDSEVTMEEVNKLGERIVEQKNDRQGDDAQLVQRKNKVDFTGKELDVPGRSVESKQNQRLKDEENQLYSQGSAENEHLETSSKYK